LSETSKTTVTPRNNIDIQDV